MFPSPFGIFEYGDGVIPLCLLEQDILKVLCLIKDKTEWCRKLLDPQISKKWMKEIQDAKIVGDQQQVIDYAFKELTHVATLHNNRESSDDVDILDGPVDGVFVSDSRINENLRSKFLHELSRLEGNPVKDWHPGTDEQVLDLVHPSLFPLIYGLSRVVSDKSVSVHESYSRMGTGEIIPLNLLLEHPPNDNPMLYWRGKPNYSKSNTYQWLPSDIEVSENGKVSFQSYINNLHPKKYADLYESLESILEKFIPLFENVLGALIHPKPNRINVDTNWYKDEFEFNGDDSQEEVAYEDYYENRPITLPETPKEIPNHLQNITEPFQLRGRRLQVIVKMANIILNPEKPSYGGGVWHIEGMENESIVATGIYYHSMENITSSKLSFRQAVQEPMYEQNDDRGVAAVYGLRNEEPLSQYLGYVSSLEGRSIAFPNILQHRVEPFELEDPSKAGHRKILVFFLVDPSNEILSTSSVPPQQREWYSEEVGEKLESRTNLPNDILHKITTDSVDWPMDMKSAQFHREKLMEERKKFVTENGQYVFERPFSLCEH